LRTVNVAYRFDWRDHGIDSVFENDKANRELILDHIYEKFLKLHHYNVVNSKANDTLYDTDIKLYKGRDYILEEMEGLKFSINAKSFYQTNSDQAYELYKNHDFAGLTGNEIVYDLYTGTGTIAQFVSKASNWCRECS
jgi:23S rRNA (uracil1939-C5)-methyltransferase